jgi:nitrogen fixation protein FixH
MASEPKHTEFTGKHMLAVMVTGFGIVVAVNFYMASLATGGFHGVVVENSYVASQKFNGWLEEAEKNEALGWQVETSRDDAGHVVLSASAVPRNPSITAHLRRPLGTHEYASLDFAPVDDGAGGVTYRSTSAVSGGRWTIRLRIEAGGESWTSESELP